jgi:hypothetical protein
MWFLAAGICGIKTYAGYSRSFLHQVARELTTFSCHDLTRGQRKSERIRLILKIENDLSRHVYFSPWLISLLHGARLQNQSN